MFQRVCCTIQQIVGSSQHGFAFQVIKLDRTTHLITEFHGNIRDLCLKFTLYRTMGQRCPIYLDYDQYLAHHELAPDSDAIFQRNQLPFPLSFSRSSYRITEPFQRGVYTCYQWLLGMRSQRRLGHGHVTFNFEPHWPWTPHPICTDQLFFLYILHLF